MARVHVNTGRYGDIICFLPVLLNEYKETGVKARLVISKDYASILDGVSYVEPLVFDGRFEDVSGAIAFAKTFSDDVRTSQVVGISDVIVSQVYGNSHAPKIICDSFQKDAWKLADKLELGLVNLSWYLIKGIRKEKKGYTSISLR